MIGGFDHPLLRALTQAETTARRPGFALRHPVRWLRPAFHRRSGPSEVSCAMFSGQRLRVVLPEIVGTELYRHGFIEPSVSRVLIEHLRRGAVFFDVGAQYGYHSLLAAALVGPAGTVVAFEPARGAFRLLTQNVTGVPGVITEPIALSIRSGTVEMRDFGPGHSALNTVLTTARVPPDERRRLHAHRYTVTATTIDDYVEQTRRVPDFIKLDAEGAELDILHGTRRTLHDAAPILSMETGDYDEMESPATAASIAFLEDLGYRSYEHRGRLQVHERRPRYGYGNLFFVKDVPSAPC